MKFNVTVPKQDEALIVRVLKQYYKAVAGKQQGNKKYRPHMIAVALFVLAGILMYTGGGWGNGFGWVIIVAALAVISFPLGVDRIIFAKRYVSSFSTTAHLGLKRTMVFRDTSMEITTLDGKRGMIPWRQVTDVCVGDAAIIFLQGVNMITYVPLKNLNESQVRDLLRVLRTARVHIISDNKKSTSTSTKVSSASKRG